MKIKKARNVLKIFKLNFNNTKLFLTKIIYDVYNQTNYSYLVLKSLLVIRFLIAF